jgi:heme-binding protein
MKKKILIGLVAILVIIQFIHPEKNLSDDNEYAIATKYEVPEEVSQIFQVACNDCHSNKTAYPWYTNIQPVDWFLYNHVEGGKKHLNFSTFTKLPIAVQNHKLEEVIEMVEEKEMPLASYTYFGLHKEANLSDDQRIVVTDWAKAQMELLKATYPPDSLVMKRRGSK